MATLNVACPYCGQETRGSIPADAKLKSVKKNTHQGDGNSTAGCSECGKEFDVNYIWD